MANVYVFRIANDQFVRDEIKNGILHQGWGDSTSILTNRSEKDWVKSRCERDCFEDNVKYYTNKYRKLRYMVDFEIGDIIVIPKTPESNKFTVCEVNSKYSFEKPNYSKDDFYHQVKIKNVKCFSYHTNETTEIIHAKLRAYQSPINHVWNETFISAAKSIINEDESLQEENISLIVNNIKDDVFKSNFNEFLSRLRKLGNRQTENIVKILFEKMGYTFLENNSYDGIGGDADLIFSDNSLSEIFDEAVNGSDVSGQIYIQIKNKIGIDDNDVNGVNQLIQITKNEINPIKILISTADAFTSECIHLANRNNIILVNGRGLVNLIMKYLN